MKSQTQIKKGCGSPFHKYDDEYGKVNWCGEKKELCPQCQALLAQSQEVVGDINNLNDEFLKKELSPEQLRALQYFIEELKSQITGEEKEE